MDFYNSFLKFIEHKYPHQFQSLEGFMPSPLLFSSAIVTLRQTHLDSIKNFINALFFLSHTDKHQTLVNAQVPSCGKIVPKNFSAFMSYDFHITEQGPKLIEINTNASMSGFSALLSEFQSEKLKTNFSGKDYFVKCRKMMEEELQYFGNPSSAPIAITDEEPAVQKAYSEFLLYRSFFSEWGWPTEIIDSKNLQYDKGTQSLKSDNRSFKCVYNRTTDFYFESENSLALREAYIDQSVCVTPNSREYALLADKQRLIDFSNSEYLASIGATIDQTELIRSIVPEIFPISKLNRVTPKGEREKYFFKPTRSFGGKAVYRGKSLSQKTFEDLLFKDYLVQELVEPPTLQVETQEGSKDFKWDLRVYAYKNEIQLLVARLYQGQMTNTQTLGGGLAPISFF